MNEKQLERLEKLVGLKAEMAKWGGAKPFDKIAGWVDKALDELVEEVEGKPKEQPKTVITPGGQEVKNPEASHEDTYRAELDRMRREPEPTQRPVINPEEIRR